LNPKLSSQTNSCSAISICVELALIQAIHRHTDGVVTFHCKQNDQFENLFAIRSGYLPCLLSTTDQRLASDAFMSVNAYWYPERTPRYLSAAQCRKPNRLRYLCACFADLDFYKLGLTYGQVIGTIVDYQDGGVIPPVSIIIRSGRGVWLVWLLRDPKNPRLPPRAFPEKQQQYRRVQQRIHERLANLGADAQDALRLLRVPGSIHSVSGERVSYFVQADDAGRCFSYTLDEIATQFGLRKDGWFHRLALKTQERQNGRRWRGPKALTEYRMKDFIRLLELRRGGFDKGCRNRAALYYAWLLKCQRIPKDDALRKVTNLGTACRPPLSAAECRDAVKSGYNPNWTNGIAKVTAKPAPPSIKYQTVSDWLDIKPEEAAQLKKYPPASRFGREQTQSSSRPTRRQVAEERRDKISRIVADTGVVPPLRRMQQLLRESGHVVSQVTVMHDYQALALVRPRAGMCGGRSAAELVNFQCL